MNFWVKNLLIFVFFKTIINGVNGQDFECLGESVKTPEASKKALMECFQEFGIVDHTKITPEIMPCLGICIFKKKNMVTEDGKIDIEKIKMSIEKHAPPKVKKVVIENMESCIKEHGDQIIVKDDTKCSGFMKVGKCIRDKFMEICTIKKM